MEANQHVYAKGVELLDALYKEPSNIQIWQDGLFNKWFRLNTLYDIKNVKGEVIQFRPNDSQTHLFVNAWYRDVILKARQLGFTTFKMVNDLDDCLFIPNFSAACIAQGLKEVQSIFDDKIKFAYENMNHDFISQITNSEFVLPRTKTDRANEYKFSNGSKFSVGTGYRSGTLQSLHVSEFGKIAQKTPDKAREIVTGSFEAVSEEGTITVESTAEGKEGRFFDLVQKAKKRTVFNKLSFKLKFYPWFENVRYTLEGEINPVLEAYFDELAAKHDIHLTDGQKAWYSAKWDDLGEDIYREYPSYPDEAFKVAVEGAYYAKQFAEIYKDRRIGPALNDEFYNVRTAWDIGTGDSTAIWFYQVVGDEIHIIDYYENSGLGLGHYLKYLASKPYSYEQHNGPHDLKQRQWASDAKSYETLAREGVACDEDKGTELEGTKYRIDFNVLPASGLMDGIEIVRNTLSRCYFYDETTERGVSCLENYRKEWDERNSCWKNNPLHDWASHGADGFRYLCVAENKMQSETVAIMSLR